MFCALHISNFRRKRIFYKLECGLEKAAFILYDAIIASAAYHDPPGPAITGVAIAVTTLHVNMMFLQLDCTQLWICQQNLPSEQEPVAYTILKIFE